MSEKDKPTVEHDHVEDVGINPYDEKLVNWDDVKEGGRKATDKEKGMGLRQALKTYRKALFWTLVVSMSTIMEGYDESLIGSFFAMPPFQKYFGKPYKDGYQVEAKWQSALGLVSPAGVVIGLLINGFTLEKFGYRKIIMAAYIGTVAFVFMTFFATNKVVLLVGELFCCINFGLLGGASLGYASEICPLALRSYFTMYCNFTFTIGHTLKAAVLLGFVNNDTQWAFRGPFMVQWAWPIPLFIGVYFAPESPWWLIRKGEYEKAKASLKRLSSNLSEGSLDNTVSMMLHTDERERELDYGTSYAECFKGVDLRRTEVACFGWMVQTFSSFGGPSNGYFFEQVGFSAASSYSFQFIGEAIALLGDVTSWFLVRYVGRRTLYLWGLTYLALQWYVIGGLAMAPESNKAAIWGQAVLIMINGYFYDVTIGPIAFTVASETPSTRLRAKTIALARSAFYVVSIVNTIINPYEINPTAWNWKGKSAFMAAGFSTLSLVWTYFRLPECKNRTFEELDILFEKKVPARKFAQTHVDAYGSDDTTNAVDAAVNTSMAAETVPANLRSAAGPAALTSA